MCVYASIAAYITHDLWNFAEYIERNPNYSLNDIWSLLSWGEIKKKKFSFSPKQRMNMDAYVDFRLIAPNRFDKRHFIYIAPINNSLNNFHFDKSFSFGNVDRF